MSDCYSHDQQTKMREAILLTLGLQGVKLDETGLDGICLEELTMDAGEWGLVERGWWRV